MKLEELMVDTKAAWIEFPGCPGFEVKVANLARKELVALRKRCVHTKFDRKTRQPEEVLDEQKFISEFSRATIKGWKGLKLKYLEDLLLVDLSGKDVDTELEYDESQAEILVSNSTEFDTWVNEVVFDLGNFRRGAERTAVGAD